MKLSVVITQYVNLGRAMGQIFICYERILKNFLKTVGDIDIGEIDQKLCMKYLLGTEPFTRSYHAKHTALNGMFRFAVGREIVDKNPLPKRLPKKPPPYQPYIYGKDELKNLLLAAKLYDRPSRTIEGNTLHTFLLVLYGCALRLGEAVKLTIGDVDFAASVLTIRDSKFYKTRYVPMGEKLKLELENYVVIRKQSKFKSDPDDILFITRKGKKFAYPTIEDTFRKLRAAAKISRVGGPRQQPRMHDLRHTAVVHRLVSWSSDGCNMHKMLPLLSTFLGHRRLRDTQHYMTVTPELLNQASQKFLQYAGSGGQQNGKV